MIVPQTLVAMVELVSTRTMDIIAGKIYQNENQKTFCSRAYYIITVLYNSDLQ